MAKKEKKEQSPEMEEAISSSSSSYPSDIEAPGIDITDQSVDALKYALYSLINNKGAPEGTTNLNPGKIKALSRMKILNHFYKCGAIDEYYENILHLRQSITTNPNSILEIMGGMFRTQPINQPGIVSRTASFLRGRQ